MFHILQEQYAIDGVYILQYLHSCFTVTFKFHAPATCSNLYAFPASFLPKASAGKTTGVSSKKKKIHQHRSIKDLVGLVTLRLSLKGLTFLGLVQNTLIHAHTHTHANTHTHIYVHTQRHAQKHMYNHRPAQTPPRAQVYNTYTECLNKTLMFITTQ